MIYPEMSMTIVYACNKVSHHYDHLPVRDVPLAVEQGKDHVAQGR